MSKKQTEGAVPKKSLAEKARISVKRVDEDLSDGLSDASTEQTSESTVKQAEKENVQKEPEFDEAGGIVMDLAINKWDLYQFLLYHSYVSVSGALGLLFSLFCLAQAINELLSGNMTPITWLVLFVGLWFTFISPLILIFRASAQMKRSPSMQKPITYVFTDKGMLQKQGEARVVCDWSMFTRAVFMKRIWVLYVGKVRGNVLPVAQMSEQKEELQELIKKHVGKHSTY